MCDREKFSALEGRVTKLEKTVEDMRNEVKSLISAVNSNIETLSQQMTNMDKRIVEEKAKWGEVFRSIVKWTTRTGLAIIAYAAGLNITKSIFSLFVS